MASNRHSQAVEAPPQRSSDDLLLDTALECILDLGWKRTTLTEVARRAAVSRMTIYRRWPDMRRLFGDLMAREYFGIFASVGAPTPDPADSGYARALAAGVVRAVALLREDPLWRRTVELDPELLLPYLLERRGRSQQAGADQLEGLIAAGVRAGTLTVDDPRRVARSIVLAAHGFLISVQTMAGDGVSIEDLDGDLGSMVERLLAS